MSINEEIDIFSEEIETPNEEFWEKILNKETQKSSVIGNSRSKIETDSNNSEDEEIIIVKELPAIPPDLLIQAGESEIEVHSKIYSQNPITESRLEVDKPLHASLSSKVFKLRKGHNQHSLYASWGQIDQYCMRKQRLIRLMALGTMIEHDEMSKRSFAKVQQDYYKLTCQLNAMIRQIQQEHKLVIENMI